MRALFVVIQALSASAMREQPVATAAADPFSIHVAHSLLVMASISPGHSLPQSSLVQHKAEVR